ncbi:hypothetical protein [Actinoplanes ianthinogenes]|nr:hypothetical protein [Actinoplanes ianthinogenes]
MYPETLTLLDDCIRQLMDLRNDLGARRRVEAGQRHDIAEQAVGVAQRFIAEASGALAEPSSDPVIRGSGAEPMPVA